MRLSGIAKETRLQASECERARGSSWYDRVAIPRRRRYIWLMRWHAAQVEGLLKQNGDKDKKSNEEQVEENTLNFDFADFAPSTEDVFLQGMDYTFPSAPIDGDPFLQAQNASVPPLSAGASQPTADPFSGELLGLGMFETLPPFEVTEALQVF